MIILSAKIKKINNRLQITYFWTLRPHDSLDESDQYAQGLKARKTSYSINQINYLLPLTLFDLLNKSTGLKQNSNTL